MQGKEKLFEKLKEVKFFGRKSKKNTEENDRYFPFSFVLALVVVTVLLLITVNYSVELNEYTIEVSTIEKEIKSLKTEQKASELLLDKKINLVEFDEYASYSLGMIKGDYTEISGEKDRGGDTIESFDGNYESGGLFTAILRAISNKFTESWNNLLR